MEETIKTQTKPVEDESFWRQHCESQKLSGRTIADYSRHHKLNYYRFKYWISKWRHHNNKKLISAKLKSTTEEMQQQILCTLHLKNGHCIKIHDSRALYCLYRHN